MKKIFLFIVLLFPICSFAQNSPLHTGEGIITLVNHGSSWNVTFTATAVSEKWDGNYNPTDEYETATDVVFGQQTVPPTITPTAYFDLANDPLAGINPIVALGNYKISAIEGGSRASLFLYGLAYI